MGHCQITWHQNNHSYIICYTPILYKLNIFIGISLKPWYGNILGGVPVVVSGPVFNPNNKYSCKFDTAKPVDCHIINTTRILCVSPRLNKTGRTEVQLYMNSTPHYLPATYYSCKIILDLYTVF